MIQRFIRGLIVMAVAVTAGWGIIATAGPALASDAIVKERQSVMRENGAHMKAIGGFLKGGKRAGSAEDVVLRAEALKHSAGRMVALFPKGTGMGETKTWSGAKPAIWSNSAGFKTAADALAREADKMIAAAKTGDKKAIGGAMKALGGACVGCHKEFQKTRPKKK